MNSAIRRAAELVRGAHHMIALTGAGISTPSGIPDFRSPGSGLWKNADPYEVASLDGFLSRPAAYYEWVRPLARLIRDAHPNPAHIALARLEAAGILKCVVTQNVDGLHQLAGSREVVELHGSHRSATCLNCLTIYPSDQFMTSVIETGDVPHCPKCGGILKPNTVLFGEMLPVAAFHRAEAESDACDLMLVAGTSLEVMPASDLPARALRHGAHLVIVNRASTYLDHLADVVIRQDVAEALPAIANLAITPERA